MSRATLLHATFALAIAALAAVLYGPFLGNPLVFDDKIFFSGRRFAYYATHPLGLDLRLPPYFSLTITQVLSGSIVAHRVISLILHIGVALALYKLLLDLQRTTLRPADERDFALRAGIGAAAFALHPVAVYGAAYLVQRSIVMATLFGLLSAVLFLRGVRRGSHADAITAALLYTLAVLSKEHAVLLPAAILPALVLAGTARRFALRHAAIYLAACAPAALFVTLRSLGVIGGVYEEGVGAIAEQVSAASGEDILQRSLALSAVTQAGLFFQYLGAWLWPSPAAMSIDVRVDFVAGWSAGWIAAKIAAFAATGGLGVWLLLRRGAASLAGFGLLYAWLLFIVEFAAVRFQEPFVLYRSYLWGPGVLCIGVAILSRLTRPGVIAAGALACAILGYAAHARLVTFSDPLRLWEDAAAKLPDRPVPWGSRTLYSLGREYLYAGQPDKAIAATERCMRLYPKTVQCVYARGVVHLQMHEYARATEHLNRALALEPGSAIMHHRLGLALECLGRNEDAEASYRRAQALGYGGGLIELQRLQAPGARRRPPACG
ncbi:MAG: tetratricopeptide repeat protein [Betaproteobacteria bacterium]|nr:tetratricopeptide repeat protein [Betaproteobacteria bacterium]MDH4322817.1 tetratricopeptide repeat protein [Betaproteobacteria bacterium]MDH5211084.1 tetratricopeptide repeat protein [Betaproteobacteria bacterium]